MFLTCLFIRERNSGLLLHAVLTVLSVTGRPHGVESLVGWLNMRSNRDVRVGRNRWLTHLRSKVLRRRHLKVRIGQVWSRIHTSMRLLEMLPYWLRPVIHLRPPMWHTSDTVSKSRAELVNLHISRVLWRLLVIVRIRTRCTGIYLIRSLNGVWLRRRHELVQTLVLYPLQDDVG